jgi:hypothetical protein
MISFVRINFFKNYSLARYTIFVGNVKKPSYNFSEMCRRKTFSKKISGLCSKYFENFTFALTTIEILKCISDNVCDINTPIFQLYTFLFVYKINFNAYAIFRAKNRGKIPDEKSIPLITNESLACPLSTLKRICIKFESTACSNLIGKK